jgi:hypothetical protein
VSLTPPEVSLLRVEWSGEQEDMPVITELSALESATHVISQNGGELLRENNSPALERSRSSSSTTDSARERIT